MGNVCHIRLTKKASHCPQGAETPWEAQIANWREKAFVYEPFAVWGKVRSSFPASVPPTRESPKLGKAHEEVPRWLCRHIHISMLKCADDQALVRLAEQIRAMVRTMVVGG
jgi:hypothetical protein